MQRVSQSNTSEIPAGRPESPARHFGRITPRAILIGIALCYINDYWVVQLEVARYSFPTQAAPFYNVVFTLLVLTALNGLARRFFPRIALSRAEMMASYVMVSITSAVISRQMMQILIPAMTHAFYFQTPENQWAELFIDKLPRWLTVSDPASLRNFYLGNSSILDPVNYRVWLMPCIWWSVFGIALLFTLLCINSILRKQWVESERLTFPIVQLPLEMTEESGALYRNRAMWIGFAVAGGLTLLAGLHALWPSIPHIQIGRRNMAAYIPNPPWSEMGNIPVAFWFWAIGLAFLMPLELSFSCWFFFWVIKFERVLCYVTGMSTIKVSGGGLDSGYPFLNCQAYGAYLAFFLMSMWSSRGYIGRVLRTAFRGTGEEDESREALSYRWAILGALAGFIVLGVFARIMGMSGWLIPVFFGLYTMIAIIATRIRAELGFPTHDIREMGPQYATVTATGSLPTKDLVAFQTMAWFNREYSSHPSPHQMEAFKISERAQNPARQMFIAALIAGTIAMPLGFWMLLSHHFEAGCVRSSYGIRLPGEIYKELANSIQNPVSPNTLGLGFVGVGFAIAMAMGWMRMNYLWFPFHPLAYAIGHSWGVVQLWCPIFIGCTAKYLIIRFGGLKLYRQSLPFFLGLILGEITIGSLWTIVGIVFNISTYDFWPGIMTN